MSDLLFEQILAQHEQEYHDAEEFGSSWMPPDTPKDDPGYIVTILGCKTGTSTKKEQVVAWWRLTGRIEDPANEALNGKEFVLGFFRTSTPGVLKSTVRALNKGESVGTLAEANKVLVESVGKIARVKVKTTVKDDGSSYTNAYVQEIIGVTEVVVVEPDQ
jgi:hypothetical protein